MKRNLVVSVGISLFVIFSLISRYSLQFTSYEGFENISPSYANSLYPVDTQLTFLPMPSLPRPGYLTPIIDPAFKTRVTRISDQQAFNMPTQQYLRHIYAKIQPWNSDETLLMLNYTYTVPVLDGKTYKFLRSIYLGDSQEIWSNTDPKTAYGRSANKLVATDMTTGAQRVLHVFPEYDSISIGKGEGNLTYDDHYLALVGIKGSNESMIVYNLVDNTFVVGALQGSPDWVSMSPSGEYVVVSWFADAPGKGHGIDIYYRNLTFARHLIDNSEHGDMNYDTQNKEVYVQFDPNTWNIVSFPLDGSASTVVHKGNWIGSNISCRNIKRPGWCFVDDNSGSNNKPGSNESYAFKLDGRDTVERFAHLHQSANQNYGADAQVVPNRDGSKILWSSNWGLGASAPVYDYIAQVDSNDSTQPTLSPCADDTVFSINNPSGYFFRKGCIVVPQTLYLDDSRFTFFAVPTELNTISFVQTGNLAEKEDRNLTWSINVSKQSDVYILYRKILGQKIPPWITQNYTKVTSDDFSNLHQFVLRKNDQGLIGVYDIYQSKTAQIGKVSFGPASDSITTAYSMYLVALHPR